MPTYDYRCDGCGHAFEEFQSMSEEPLRKCPACRKKKLRRLIGTGAAILFKGSGFYQTDYRSESYKSAAKADEKGGSTGAASANGASAATDTAKTADSATTTTGDKSATGKTTGKKPK
jgi:putative FmdB family regulatory protein